MDLDQPTSLLGGLTPNAFMRRHWQRKPLLIRQAFPQPWRPPLNLAAVRRLAKDDDVESRLIWRERDSWQMEYGPFARLPRNTESAWTLLVQGVDLHDDATAELLQRFRFVADARLDDAMISIAGDGGGVGPHFDSYDVFLLQAAGRRRWRYGRQTNLAIEPDVPLKILRNFTPQHDVVLEPGDMLYLPPDVAHDGTAVGDGCMTISIGFRSPSRLELMRGMLELAADELQPGVNSRLDRLYRDAGGPATLHPGEIPAALVATTLKAMESVKWTPQLANRFLGSWLSEPKPQVVFDPAGDDAPDLLNDWPTYGSLKLDRRSRMLYRDRELFINGEAAMVTADRHLKQLADARQLDCASGLPHEAVRARLQDWLEAGWLHWQAS